MFQDEAKQKQSRKQSPLPPPASRKPFLLRDMGNESRMAVVRDGRGSTTHDSDRHFLDLATTPAPVKTETSTP
jgi:hypothetical protein